jgi:DNA-binding beta-propeller fold protein YncE
MTSPRHGRCGRLGLLVLLTLQISVPTTARAQDRLYFSDDRVGGVHWVGLDGSGILHDVATAGQITLYGIAIDSADGRIYWADNSANKISWAPLDGSAGGGDVTLTARSGSTAGLLNGPHGLAINPDTRRLYWTNATGNSLASARLDGSDAVVLTPGGSTRSYPSGLVIDPVWNRLYWANRSANKVSWGGMTPTGGAGEADFAPANTTPASPFNVALDTDPIASSSQPPGRIYWTNNTANKISWTSVSTAGTGGDLTVNGPSVTAPRGVAIDPDAGTLYWANTQTAPQPGSIASVNLSTHVGATVAPAQGPYYLALLKTPKGTGAPAVTGGSTPGSQLSCSSGAWAPDLTASSLYRAPQAVTYQWTKDGTDIGGATTSVYTADNPGDYRCRVTGTNVAGATAQTSDVHQVAAPAPPPGDTSSTTPPPADTSNTSPSSDAPASSDSSSPSPATPALSAPVFGATPHAVVTKAKVNARKRTASFTFRATAPVTRFQCALVVSVAKGRRAKAPVFSTCRSPKTYRRLKRGRYKLEVRVGNTDRAPAVRPFTV